VLGAQAAITEIKKELQVSHSDWNGGAGQGIIISSRLAERKVFEWEGIRWDLKILMPRLFWMLAAAGLVLLSSKFFNRFDPDHVRKQRDPWYFRKKKLVPDASGPLPAIGFRTLPRLQPKFSFPALVKAELNIMLNGRSGIWLLVTAGLWVASIFTPLRFAWQVMLPLLWFWQVLVLSKLGSRETSSRTAGYIFSAAFPVLRQLPACLAAAFTFILVLALPVLTRVSITGDFYGVAAILAGALFIPVFAISSGILTGGSKLFEVVFTMAVYGMLNRIPFLDLAGALPESRSYHLVLYTLVITGILLVAAFVGRQRQVCSS
jgi:hypothetical protein